MFKPDYNDPIVVKRAKQGYNLYTLGFDLVLLFYYLYVIPVFGTGGCSGICVGSCTEAMASAHFYIYSESQAETRFYNDDFIYQRIYPNGAPQNSGICNTYFFVPLSSSLSPKYGSGISTYAGTYIACPLPVIPGNFTCTCDAYSSSGSLHTITQQGIGCFSQCTDNTQISTGPYVSSSANAQISWDVYTNEWFLQITFSTYSSSSTTIQNYPQPGWSPDFCGACANQCWGITTVMTASGFISMLLSITVSHLTLRLDPTLQVVLLKLPVIAASATITILLWIVDQEPNNPLILIGIVHLSIKLLVLSFREVVLFKEMNFKSLSSAQFCLMSPMLVPLALLFALVMSIPLVFIVLFALPVSLLLFPLILADIVRGSFGYNTPLSLLHQYMEVCQKLLNFNVATAFSKDNEVAIEAADSERLPASKWSIKAGEENQSLLERRVTQLEKSSAELDERLCLLEAQGSA